MASYYYILGVPEDADSTDIKRAYRRLALRCHPDRADGEGDETRFDAVTEAFQVLSSPSRRGEYDERKVRKSATYKPWSSTPRDVFCLYFEDVVRKSDGVNSDCDVLTSAENSVLSDCGTVRVGGRDDVEFGDGESETRSVVMANGKRQQIGVVSKFDRRSKKVVIAIFEDGKRVLTLQRK